MEERNFFSDQTHPTQPNSPHTDTEPIYPIKTGFGYEFPLTKTVFDRIFDWGLKSQLYTCVFSAIMLLYGWETFHILRPHISFQGLGSLRTMPKISGVFNILIFKSQDTIVLNWQYS